MISIWGGQAKAETLILSLTPSDSLLSKHLRCVEIDNIESIYQLSTLKNDPLRLTYLKFNLDKASEWVGFNSFTPHGDGNTRPSLNTAKPTQMF